MRLADGATAAKVATASPAVQRDAIWAVDKTSGTVYIPAGAASPVKQVIEHWGLINKLARKKFRRESLCLEATDYVLWGLERENRERARKHSGHGTLSCCLYCATERLLLYFTRSKFGRNQPRRWLEKRRARHELPLSRSAAHFCGTGFARAAAGGGQ